MEDHPVSTVVGGGMQEWANMHRRLIGRQASAGLIQSALGGSDTVCIATEGEREREGGTMEEGSVPLLKLTAQTKTHVTAGEQKLRAKCCVN